MLPTPDDLSRRLDLAMTWFPTLCRNLGRTIHDLGKPPRDPHKQVVKHKVEEQQLSSTTTLRRTTIEEVEIRQDAFADKDK